MQFRDREEIGSENPRIYIGHRVGHRPGKKVVSRAWYAEYCIDSKQRQVSLGTSNKSAALKKAWELYARLQHGEQPAVRSRITIDQVFKEYLDMQRARGRAPRTIEKYELVERNVRAWMKDKGLRRAASLGEHDFWSFRKHLADQGLQDKTIYDRCVVVKQAFKWATGKARLIPRNPFDGISMTKPEPTQQPCFSPQQIGLLLANASDHMRPIITLLAHTGMRFGEVRDLRWEDVRLDDGDGFIVVRRGGSRPDRTKNSRIRRIPMHPRVREELMKMKRLDDRVFHALPSTKYPDGTGQLDERRLLVSVKRFCKRAGLPDPNQYKIHTFRHTFASMCARNNVSYKYALEWMGHRDSAILDLYYTMFDRDAHVAIRSISYDDEAAAWSR